MAGIFAAPAQADSWSSHLTGVAAGFESRRWTEASSDTTTNIKFTGCSGAQSVVNVTFVKDNSLSPDTYYTKAAFTACFASSTATSSGNWDDHGAGNYYFVVNDGGGDLVTVKSLTVTY
ncbi:hypothetical protein [Streptomyces sp. 8L]|uniref:hypothetical protein n=1 Tax=Streptomyces sp. 8L TaxID=2877242 RepID=UPI001CD675FA|nr:hypothetical protein [Streptomyces sp. 8L]MCA1223622.1 hypothetical protein [Streptomyces sp. 8L]